MFQTEPILWLQALGSPALSWLLEAVTWLGSTAAYAPVLLVLALGWRLRPSLTAGAAVLLAVLSCEVLKVGLALPRPNNVDTRVVSVPAAPAVVERGGARGFWALPGRDTVAAVRARRGDSFGFPSGHVAAATALCLGAVRFFRSKRALAFAAAWVPAMALSRMYLGRHFLADVLGGLAVGALALTVAWRAIDPLDAPDAARGARPLGPGLLLAATLVLLTPFVEELQPLAGGCLVGLVAGYAWLLRSGTPPEAGTPGRRLARVLLGGSVCGVTALAAWALLQALALGRSRLGLLSAAALVTTATLAGAGTLSRRLGLYTPG